MGQEARRKQNGSLDPDWSAPLRLQRCRPIFIASLGATSIEEQHCAIVSTWLAVPADTAISTMAACVHRLFGPRTAIRKLAHFVRL